MKKLSKKQICIILVVLAIVAAVVTYCFSSCNREIIGYDPETPQEWLDELEAEANRTDMEITRTYDFDGIWRNKDTGEYYQIYMGHIFKLNNPEPEFGEYFLWGTVVAIQTVDKEIGETISQDGGNLIEANEEFQMHINSSFSDIYEATTTMLENGDTKTVTADGKEFNFELVQYVDDWPKGYSM